MIRDTQQHQFPEARRVAVRQLLVDAAGTRPPRRRPTRLVIVGIAAVALVATGGAAAYSLISSSPVANKSDARCYTEAKYAKGDNFPGTSIAQATSTGHVGQVDSALDVCRDLWRQGFLQLGDPRVNRATDTTVDHPVPPLFACVLPDGRAAVFPGTLTCSSLGLVPPSSDPS